MTQEGKSLPSKDESLPSEEKSLISLDSDFLLMTLVHLVNVSSLKMGITLFIQGTVVSGVLISKKLYFEGVSNQLKTMGLFPTDVGDDAIDTLINSLQPPTNSSDILEAEKLPIKAEFIHLENVRIQYGNSSTLFNQKVFWRGRLSRIDGFFLGHLE
jgi:hypothetical protein